MNQVNPEWIRAGAEPWHFDPSGLLDYQVEPAKHLLKVLAENAGALDASDMGTGKTFTAASVIRSLNLPTLAVVPAVSITSWNRAGAAMGTSFDVLNYEMIRTGRTDYGKWEYERPARAERIYYCTNCQKNVDPVTRCEVHHAGIHCIEVKNKSHNYGKFRWHSGVKFLVFDEVHRAGAIDSLHSEMLLAARRQGVLCLGLSATVATTPLNFKALGYVLGLHSYVDTPRLPGFYRWAAGYGCGRDNLRGFCFRGTPERQRLAMGKLHDALFPARGVRIRIEELGDQFPDCQITAELYDLEQNGQIEALYREMAEALAEFVDRVGSDESSSPLVRVLRARQKIELLKLPVYEELTKQSLEAGRSVAIFLNFTQSLDELCKRLKTQCRVDGSQTGESGRARRQKNIDDFQENSERIIILNAQAGGVALSLHDIHGGFPRTGLVSLGYSATTVQQVFGRLRRAGGKSKALYRIPLIAGTVEERVHKLVVPKLNNLDALNDNDLWTENLPLTRRTFSTILDEVYASTNSQN